MEYLVRAARVTDIDRFVALSEATTRPDGAATPLGAVDLLRQLVYLPQATVLIAEAQRIIVGGAIFALRPSVRVGGYIGTIDLLVVDPGYDVERIGEALVDELVRSARNKGCTIVEAAAPDDPTTLKRWQAMGFAAAGPKIERIVTSSGRATR